MATAAEKGKPKKRRLTVYLDPEVARAARVRAARTDKRDSEVIEDALVEYLGLKALNEAQDVARYTEEEAMRVAYEELHAMRRGRRAAA